MNIKIIFKNDRGLSFLAALIFAAVIIIAGGVVIHYLRQWVERLDGNPLNPNTNNLDFSVPLGSSNDTFIVMADSISFEYIDQNSAVPLEMEPGANAQPTLELCIFIDTNSGALINWMTPIPTNWSPQSLTQLNVPTDPGSGIPDSSVWSSAANQSGIPVLIYRSMDLVNWTNIDSIYVAPGVTNIYIDPDPPECRGFYVTMYQEYVQDD